MTTKLVAGEPVDQLVAALADFKTKKLPNGMMEFKSRTPPELAPVLFRALLRVEADLLREDAEQLTRANLRELRTPEQRGADALVELVRRFGD